MKIISTFLLSAAISVNALAFSPTLGYRTVDAYDKKHAANVLQRSVFYAPVWGGLYKEKWEEVVANDPNVRGVAIQLHGCAGLFHGEKVVADFYINRLGLAVITPDFTGRPGNKTGCPGRGSDEALKGAFQRFDEMVFTARNPHRMSARTDDLQILIDYVKSITNKPIILGGHSEGGRTVYHYNKVEPQIIGMILHAISCGDKHAHIFRMPTSYKTFQYMENNDPWLPDGMDCRRYFKGKDEKNITVFRQEGTSHRPLNNEEVRRVLKNWVDDLFGGEWKYEPIHNEALLPGIQRRLQKSQNQ